MEPRKIEPRGPEPLPSGPLEVPDYLIPDVIMKVFKAIYAYLKGRLTEGDTHAAVLALVAWFNVRPELVDPIVDIAVGIFGALGILIPQKGDKKENADG